MKIAAIQLRTIKQSKQDAIAHALAMLDGCRNDNLAILPEEWNIGFYNFENYYALAEKDNGETMSAISAKARELGIWIYSGTFVEERDGKYYNTGILFDREGKVRAKYSKIHLFDFESREKELLTAGNQITVADTEFGKIGIATCYDLRFPELFRKMAAEKGAEIFIISAAWPKERIDAWNLFNRARALENQCWLVSSNCTGQYENIIGGGHGKVVAPNGEIVADSGFEESIVRYSISADEVKRVRNNFNAIKDVKLI